MSNDSSIPVIELSLDKEKTSLDVPPLDVAMNSSTLQEYLKQQNKWANLGVPTKALAEKGLEILRGLSKKRFGPKLLSSVLRGLRLATKGLFLPYPCCPLLAVTLKGGSTVNKTEGVAATTAEVTTREAFNDFFPTMVVEG
ncbi:hypothetical protein GOBAR_DD01477 [Gossypium barbadense]|nr:hypothetical protein GOBAR_DD01477 [Gossypium barbadense]